jgi:calcineurin-like phosphoesterase family protein
MDGIRVSLINDNRTIRCEYDLVQKRMLDRTHALNKGVTAATLRMLRNKNGMQQYAPIYRSVPSIFIYGDTHFGHDNIIKYCGRPFSSVREMDDVLKDNWNNTVSDRDNVYFLGDMSHDRHGAPYWMNKLNGDITYIHGNHDIRGIGVPYKTLAYKGYNFLLVHSPDKIPIEWNGWIIHGHKHNNDVYNYPFINGEKKTINVGAELVKYKPLDIDKLLLLNIESIKRMDTIGSTPERWDGS